MSIKKTILLMLLLITMLFIAIMPVTADEIGFEPSSQEGNIESENVLSEGVFSYYIYNNSATISKCNDTESKTVTIPAKLGGKPVTSIESGAFSLCTNLSGFQSRNQTFTANDGVLYSEDILVCYPPAKSGESFYVPTKIKEIAGCAFLGNTNLEYISIPGNVKTINHEAFAGCENLETVILNNGTEKICDAAFAFCKSIKNIDLPDTLIYIGSAAFYECSSIEKIHLGNNIKTIDSIAFQECSNIKSINIPDSVSNIEEWLFSLSENLETIEISPKNPDFVVKDNLVYSKDQKTLVFCPDSLKANTVTVAEGTETIGEKAFESNKNLTSVSFPQTLKKIGSHAFYGAQKLTNIEIPSSVSEVGSYAFFGCPMLGKTVIFPSLETIGEGAFNDCISLTIYAAKGSAVYFYCMENNVEFRIDETQPEVEVAKWSQGYIDWATSQGIVSGVTDYTVMLNYEGLCWLMVNLYESVKGPIDITIENPFTDTDCPAVLKAIQLGLVEPAEADRFDGARPVTRQVMCVNIYHLMNAINGHPLVNTEKFDFRDSCDIAHWAVVYIDLAYHYNIIYGLPDGRILPKGNTSIEAALGILYNASLLIEK